MEDHREGQTFLLLFSIFLIHHKDLYLCQSFKISGSRVGKFAFIEKAVLGRFI